MTSSVQKRILVLGSGSVAPPCIEYLSRNPNNQITVASRTLQSAKKLAASFPRTTSIALDVTSDADLSKHIATHDVVISLIPFIHHASVIKAAIKTGTHVVTTSYISPAMRSLHSSAKSAGITVLNEVGVDPGVDHLYAIKKINEVHDQGGKVLEFYSYCGGLPVPECADNPLGFKFSWSPRGALLSQRNFARFLRDGVVEEIASDQLMATAAPYYVKDRYEFVAYPNRDSVPFREFYGIPEARTVVRGSLRYAGNAEFVGALGPLGWLEQDRKEWLSEGMTWAEIQKEIIGAADIDELYIVHFSNDAECARIIAGLKWIGLCSSDKATIVGNNLLDTLCAQLEKLMSYAPGERNLVMLQHKFVVEWLDGTQDTFTSTLELLGDPNGFSAMARSVGVTCGIATQLLLDGHPALCEKGVVGPYSKEMCEAIREVLEKEGVKMVEEKVA